MLLVEVGRRSWLGLERKLTLSRRRLGRKQDMPALNLRPLIRLRPIPILPRRLNANEGGGSDSGGPRNHRLVQSTMALAASPVCWQPPLSTATISRCFGCQCFEDGGIGQ